MAQQKNISDATARPSVARMVEDVVGCKWSLTVLDLVRRGVRRPGAMEQAVPGSSAKVLNERLRKLTRFGILERRSYPEVPPRVEYRLTDFGERFSSIMDSIHRLEEMPAPAVMLEETTKESAARRTDAGGT